MRKGRSPPPRPLDLYVEQNPRIAAVFQGNIQEIIGKTRGTVKLQVRGLQKITKLLIQKPRVLREVRVGMELRKRPRQKRAKETFDQVLPEPVVIKVFHHSNLARLSPHLPPALRRTPSQMKSAKKRSVRRKNQTPLTKARTETAAEIKKPGR